MSTPVNIPVIVAPATRTATRQLLVSGLPTAARGKVGRRPDLNRSGGFAKLTAAVKSAALNEEDVMAMLAMAFPIPAGKTEQWKKFIDELTGARKAEFAASRRSLGVRERTFLQHTPQGDLVLVTLEGDHPETAFAEFGKRTDPFTMWFKQQVSEIHGMDLSAPPPGPMPQQVIDSHS